MLTRKAYKVAADTVTHRGTKYVKGDKVYDVNEHTLRRYPELFTRSESDDVHIEEGSDAKPGEGEAIAATGTKAPPVPPVASLRESDRRRE